MVTKIEIENPEFTNIIIKPSKDNKYISIYDKDNTANFIPIMKDSIWSIITSLIILYKQMFNVDYPNKNE